MSFNELIAAFANNLLPILLIASAGFTLGKLLTMDSRSIGRVIFYVFSPVLIFDLMIKSELDLRQALTTVAYTASFIFTIGVIAFLLGRAFRLERMHLLAVILTASIGNTGNYGLPLVKFAFGTEALAVASLFFVTTTLVFNTAGVVIASLGHTNLKSALLRLFKIPVAYAILIAVPIKALEVQLLLPLARTVEIAANGTIPLMLILLGLELSRIQWSHSFRAIGLGVFTKLAIGPIVGILLADLFGLEGAARQANIVETAVPTAVVTTVVATEYNLLPPLVTAIVFTSTLLSPLTITPLLVYLAR